MAGLSPFPRAGQQVGLFIAVVLLSSLPHMTRGTALESGTTAVMPPDGCLELALVCIAEIDGFQKQPLCQKLKSTLECLNKVLEQCRDKLFDDFTSSSQKGSQSESSSPHDLPRTDQSQSSSSDDLGSIDQSLGSIDSQTISILVKDTELDFKENCPAESKTGNSKSSGQRYSAMRLPFIACVLFSWAYTRSF